MKFQANIPLQTPGLVSPGLKKAYHSIVAELARGAEPPSRELGLRPEEGLATGGTRLLKLYALDYPTEFLRRGAKGIEDPSKLSGTELLDLAGGAISGGFPGGGLGPASMAGRVPLKGFFSPLQKGLRELVKEGTGKGKAVTKPGQALLNLLKKKGISKEELEWTGVEKMLAGEQKPIPLKSVMKQAISEEIKIKPKVFRARSVQAEQKLNSLVKEKDDLWHEFHKEAAKHGTTPGQFASSELVGKFPVLDTLFKQFREKRRELDLFVRTKGKEKTQYADPAYRKPFAPSKEIPYEETLLTLKGGEGVFKDPSHYEDIENLITWSRSEVRPGESGEKVRLIQEVQESEWGIKGRREGFGKPTGLTLKEELKLKSFGERTAKGETFTGTEEDEWLNLAVRAGEDVVFIPETPLKKDALKLMLKKELFEAASDPTVTHLGWTPGAMQAFERWPAPEAEKKLLQLYDEIIPGFLKKQVRRLGKGKEAELEKISIESGKKPSEKLRQLEHGFLTKEEYKKLKTTPERVPTYEKVPTIKMEDWLRERVLKGQRIAKVDRAPFKEFMYG